MPKTFISNTRNSNIWSNHFGFARKRLTNIQNQAAFSAFAATLSIIFFKSSIWQKAYPKRSAICCRTSMYLHGDRWLQPSLAEKTTKIWEWEEISGSAASVCWIMVLFSLRIMMGCIPWHSLCHFGQVQQCRSTALEAAMICHTPTRHGPHPTERPSSNPIPSMWNTPHDRPPIHGLIQKYPIQFSRVSVGVICCQEGTVPTSLSRALVRHPSSKAIPSWKRTSTNLGESETFQGMWCHYPDSCLVFGPTTGTLHLFFSHKPLNHMIDMKLTGCSKTTSWKKANTFNNKVERWWILGATSQHKKMVFAISTSKWRAQRHDPVTGWTVDLDQGQRNCGIQPFEMLVSSDIHEEI